MKRHSFASAGIVALATLPLAFAPLTGFSASKTAPSGGGNWSSGTAVSPALQPDPTRGAQVADVAVNASGTTIAAWDQYTYSNGGGATIGVAVRSGGRWSAPFTLSGSTGWAMNPRVAVGRDGTMAVSWTYEDPSTQANPMRIVQVAVKPAGSSAWTTTSLATGTPGGVSIPHFVPVAIDDGGNVTAAWTYWDGTHSVLQTARLAPPYAKWSPVETLPGVASTESAMYPDMAVDAKANVAVVFSLSSCAGCNMPVQAMYAFRPAAGGWTVPVSVSGSPRYYISSPMVALDATGLATVIYFGAGIEATRQLPDGKWTLASTIVAPLNAYSSYGSFDLGVDDNGNALVAASIFDGTVNVDRSSVWVTRGNPSGDWTTPQRLTDPAVPIDAYAANVAVSPDGTLAMAGWIDHYHGTVQVAQLAGGTQNTASSNTWTTTTIGRGTAFSSFQEVLILDAGSGTTARALWKNAKSGTQWYASSYGQ